ncbi:MAG: response regulator [candidate division Zixibacteria bacterium]|nr:response regulator [candidate division Zixibacteria bacterium]MDD5426099.1 response regulator [candidate division Zixibacteria bacterium]
MNGNVDKIKLLMVDDEKEFLETSARSLSRRDFEVHLAFDGTTALQMLKQDRYDVVVLDVKMPGLDGVEVFHRIQNQWPEIPVILLTGHGTISQAFQTSKEGIADYLTKPCDIDELARRIKEILVQAKDKSLPAGTPSEVTTDLVHVLLVDDEIELLESLKKILERRQMEVHITQSGEQALEILKKTYIDVVVLDVKMPGIDGLETLQIMKRKFPAVEVILLTGHPSVDTAIRGIKLGASEYLIKPAKDDSFANIIHRVYNNRRENIARRDKEIIDEIRRNFTD